VGEGDAGVGDGGVQGLAAETGGERRAGPYGAKQPGGPDAVLAAGLVISALEADQRDARAHFAERFAAFSSAQERKLVRDTFPTLA